MAKNDSNAGLLAGGLGLVVAIVVGAIVLMGRGAASGARNGTAQARETINQAVDQATSGSPSSQPQTSSGTPVEAVVRQPLRFGDEAGVTGLVEEDLGGSDGIVSPDEAEGTGVGAYPAELVDTDAADQGFSRGGD